MKMTTAGKFLILIFLMISFGAVGWYFLLNNRGEREKIKSDLLKPVSFLDESIEDKTEAKNPLKQVVDQSLSGTKGAYAVSIKNLKTGQSYNYNEHISFESGSLYKLWIMATAYKQIAAGQLSPDEVLTNDVATLNEENNISTDSAELTDGSISLSVNDALNQMITISHNYAALLLADRVGLNNVAIFLKDNGFTESSIGNGQTLPYTTSSDTALFFDKLYHGQLGDQKSTDEMLTLLKNQQLNGKLPKYLPNDVIIAHKTGEIDYFSHDAGIVYAPNGDYIIAVLSKSDNRMGADDRIGQISNSIYQYFLKGGE